MFVFNVVAFCNHVHEALLVFLGNVAEESVSRKVVDTPRDDTVLLVEDWRSWFELHEEVFVFVHHFWKVMGCCLHCVKCKTVDADKLHGFEDVEDQGTLAFAIVPHKRLIGEWSFVVADEEVQSVKITL